jgi:hypothetical protein
MSKTSQEILKKIEKEKICPKGRWCFLLRDYVIWIFLAVFIILGSLAVSTILFIVTTQDWDVHEYLGKSFSHFVLMSFPHFWAVVFSVAILLVFYSFTRTRYGYRQAVSRVFLASIAAALVLGTGLFFCGINCQVHEFFSKYVPFYDALIYYKEDIWENPEKGLLGGTITEIKSKNEFQLTDFKGKTWQIESNDITWPTGMVPASGTEIKLMGHCGMDDIFYGNAVRNW